MLIEFQEQEIIKERYFVVATLINSIIKVSILKSNSSKIAV